MRIVHGVKFAGSHPEISVQCAGCFRMVPIKECLIDLDGPAFKAYYHTRCLVELPEERLL